MVVALVTIFIIGYFFIAMEHPFKINKTATALTLGTFLWTFFVFCEQSFVGSAATSSDLALIAKDGWHGFIGDHLIENLGETAEIVFFLLGAMTIVTLIEDYQGFRVITDKITTTDKKKLLWVISILTFFLSALLDNMTTAIVMIALLRKLIADQKERWLYAGMVILAANAGGAWSPIGDVTTIMLWIGGQVTTVNIIVKTIIASLVCMVVPVLIVGPMLKGDIERPAESNSGVEVPVRLRKLILFMGIGALIFVPIFKTITHLPPYLGMLFGLAILWMTTEIISRKYEKSGHKLPTAVSTLEHIDTPTILFFLGILMAVSCLKVHRPHHRRPLVGGRQRAPRRSLHGYVPARRRRHLRRQPSLLGVPRLLRRHRRIAPHHWLCRWRRRHGHGKNRLHLVPQEDLLARTRRLHRRCIGVHAHGRHPLRGNRMAEKPGIRHEATLA